jgi:glyoxylase-like metal-dependent hydrolase (beta-lactamase superfamily II)
MKKWILVILLAAFATSLLAQGLKRTADPKERGYKDSEFPRIQKIADNVYSYEAVVGTTERYTTNSMFVVTSEGVLVADGQGSHDAVKQMLDAIAKVTPQPVKIVVMCSDHGDHTNGNSAFPAGVEFIAHPNSKANLERQASAPNRRGNAPPVVMPTTLVADKRVLKPGGTEIQIQFLGRAHTGGDLVVYLPRERVLFASEIVLNHMFPAMRSAYPSEWLQVFKKLESIDARIVIPGHGFVDDAKTLHEELQAYVRSTEAVIAEARRLHKAGVPVEDAVKQANFGEFNSWSGASSQGPIAIRRVYDELEGRLN